MATAKSLQPRIFSYRHGNNSIRSTQPLLRIFRIDLGVTTDETDEAVHNMIIENGAYPSPLGYEGFPKSVCTSVNECICHGIPDSRPLKDGDIINIDVTVYLNLLFLWRCRPESQKASPGDKGISRYVDLELITRKLANPFNKHKYVVVRNYVGHGTGRIFDTDPIIHHSQNNVAGPMVLNQTFTIEPMLIIGSITPVTWDDKWTMVTEDASLSAQLEHTILITKHGAEILTNC